MRKENNTKRHPGVKGVRPDNKEHKREEAIQRQSEYDNLTLEQKVARLDASGFVAKKQRARLAKQISERDTKHPVKEAKTEETSTEHKHLKAKERRAHESKDNG